MSKDLREEIKKNNKAKSLKNAEKLLPQTFIDGIQAAKDEELKSAISRAAIELVELDTHQAEDDKLNALKEQLKDLSSGYSDTRKVLKAKIKYCTYILESRGKV